MRRADVAFGPAVRAAVGRVDAVEMACRHRVVEQQVSTRDYNYREATADMNAGGCHPRETTTFGEAYHWGDNYLTAGMPMTAIRRRSPAFTPGFGMSVILNGQTRMQATTSCPTLCPGQVLKVIGGEEVAVSLLRACSSRRCTATPARCGFCGGVCRHTDSLAGSA